MSGIPCPGCEAVSASEASLSAHLLLCPSLTDAEKVALLTALAQPDREDRQAPPQRPVCACGFAASSGKGLRSHRATGGSACAKYHRSLEGRRCSLCHFEGGSIAEQEGHLREKHPDSVKRFACDCGFATGTRSNLLNHVQTLGRGCAHFKQAQEARQCTKGPFEATSRDARDKHFREAHPESSRRSRLIEKLQCEKCGFETGQLAKMDKHKTSQMACSQIMRRHCILCRFVGRNWPEVRDHQRSEHGRTTAIKASIQPNRCSACCKGFVELSDLEEHSGGEDCLSRCLALHTMAMGARCSDCGYQGSNLLAHLYELGKCPEAEKDPSKCSECSAVLPSAKALSSHTQSRLGCRLFREGLLQKRSRQKFICEACGHESVSSAALGFHIPWCTGIRKCDTCGKQFSRGQNLPFHMEHCHGGKRVFNVRDVKCDRCGVMRISIGLLVLHLKRCGQPKPRGNRDPVECHACGLVLSRSDKLRRHLGRCRKLPPSDLRPALAPREQPVACDYCGTTLTRQDKLGRHLERCGSSYGRLLPNNSADKTIACDDCGSTLSRHDKLPRQLRACWKRPAALSHSLREDRAVAEPARVTCVTCPFESSDPRRMEKHRGEGLDACQRQRLLAHKAELGMGEGCLCGVQTASTKEILRHFYHSRFCQYDCGLKCLGEVNTALESCDDCGYRAKREHLCDHCGTTLSRQDKLGSHLERCASSYRRLLPNNSADKTIVCDVCGSTLPRRAPASTHIRQEDAAVAEPAKLTCDTCPFGSSDPRRMEKHRGESVDACQRERLFAHKSELGMGEGCLCGVKAASTEELLRHFYRSRFCLYECLGEVDEAMESCDDCGVDLDPAKLRLHNISTFGCALVADGIISV